MILFLATEFHGFARIKEIDFSEAKAVSKAVS